MLATAWAEDEVSNAAGKEIAYAMQPIAEVSTSEESLSNMGGFTPEQVRKILSLIENPKSNHERLSGKKNWLLDSGASCYMTACINLLHDVHDMSSIQGELPNGVHTLATKKGLARLKL